ncbi:MAG: pseudouridine synthase [Opitutales bacterium]
MSEECLSILYQDDHYVSVDKPSGLLVHRSLIDKTETRFCIQILRDQLGRRVYPCHRLDKPTSGVLLFALSKEALKEANQLFVAHLVRKTYQAILRGWTSESGRIDHPLRHAPEGGQQRGQGEPQQAITDYRRLQRYEVNLPAGGFPTARYSLAELRPRTGRMHQLRRHMKHINHHIIGDTRYGDGVHNRLFREHFHSHRLLLNASRLEFQHPFTGAMVDVQSRFTREFAIRLPIVPDSLQSPHAEPGNPD